MAMHRGLEWRARDLDHFRDACLRFLIAGAYAHVPFYRRLLDQAGVAPSDIRGVSDLDRLPVRERDELQAAPMQERIAVWASSERLITHRSTGSTGEPLLTKRTWLEERALAGMRLQVHRKYGLGIFDRRVSISTNTDELAKEDRPIASYAGLFRRRVLDAVGRPEDILARLRHLRPQVIEGYPSSIHRVAGCITPTDRLIIQPRYVRCGAEVLLPNVRRDIAAAFGCPVHNTYGVSEANLLAWECPHTRYLHVCDHAVILEVLRRGVPAGVGEEGEVFITPLHSHAMPFLRYHLTDVVTRGPTPCPCGHPSSTLMEIQGRTQDWFLDSEARKLHPYTVTNAVMDHGPWVRRFQVIQISRGDLLIKVVPAHAMTEVGVTALAMAVMAKLGNGMRVSVELTDDLAPPPGRKFKLFVPLTEES